MAARLAHGRPANKSSRAYHLDALRGNAPLESLAMCQGHKSLCAARPGGPLMFTSLFSCSQALQNYLTAKLVSIPPPGLGFGGGGGAIRQVSLLSPFEMRSQLRAEGLSVWLYRIDRDDMRLNQPDRRISPTLIRTPPLPLRLHYMMTPVTFKGGAGGSPEVEQKIMGRVLQALHTKPILTGVDLDGTDFEGTEAELHLRIEALGLDEVSRVWEALEGSFQLCVSYEISLVNVDPDLEPRQEVPVSLALPEVALVVGAEP